MNKGFKTGIPALDKRPLWNGSREFSLKTPRKLLASLKNPQNSISSIHIGGTNGKGSISAFLASILMEEGFRVGQFTSPHLTEVRERAIVDAKPLSLEELKRAVNLVLETAEREGLDPSFFELMLASSYLEFKRKELDWMVIEAGLGARLDATNLMDNQKVTVISNISYDHTQILGDTLEKIAEEKSYIMRLKVPLILGPVKDSVREVFLKKEKELKTKVFKFGKDFYFDKKGDKVCFLDYPDFYMPKTLPLLGEHQKENALVSVMTSRVLGLSDKSIVDGLKTTRWPGRLEWILGDKIVPNSKVLLDVAHNEDGAKVVMKYIKTYIKENPKIKTISILLSILERKDWRKMLDIIKGSTEELKKEFLIDTQFFFTTSENKTSVNPKEFKNYLKEGKVIPSYLDALKESLIKSQKSGFTLALGSIYLIGTLRPHLTTTFKTKA